MKSFAMLRVAAVLAALAGFTTTSASSGEPYYASVQIVNNSNHDAWVDISWAYKTTGWTIDKVYCLIPGGGDGRRIQYNTPVFGPEFRVRAEIKNGDCRAGNITTVQGVESMPGTAVVGGSYVATIEGKSSYSVVIRKIGNR